MQLIKNMINFHPSHICEVGTYTPDNLHCQDFIQNVSHTKFSLVDANPNCIQQLKSQYNDRSDVNIFNYAIADYSGKINLYNRWSGPDASAFIEGLPHSPSIINDGYNKLDRDIIVCDCITFDKIDTGDIDLLFIDIEGAEWFVIKNMISRPKIISIETHGQKYINPFMNEINDWMLQNKYITVGHDNTDTFYAKND
jgi:FkbM family methyltransferase